MSLRILCFLLFFASFHFSDAQYKQRKKQQKVTCPFSYHKKAFSNGIGVRIGDPVGLTYKLYYHRRWAFEVTGGIGFSGRYASIHSENFENIPGFEEFEYVAHNVDYSYAQQGRFLYSFPVPAYPTLSWYVGLGYEIKWIGLTYTYSYQNDNGFKDFASQPYNSIDVGPDYFVGFEYDYPRARITAFAEAGFFTNLKGTDKFSVFQGGMGVRYDF